MITTTPPATRQQLADIDHQLELQRLDLARITNSLDQDAPGVMSAINAIAKIANAQLWLMRAMQEMKQ